jgi:glycosyltransferase involved in cell wall biosynthesis
VLAGPALDADYLERLKERISRLGLQDLVRLAGARDDVASLYMMADAFVLPSFWEGWSLALSEAAYVGLPLVATDVGGARDLLSETGGRLVQPPFESITDLDCGTIGRLVSDEHPQFIADLAEAMEEVLKEPRRGDVPPELRALLDQQRAAHHHALLYAWLMQAGSAWTARAWFHAPDSDGSVGHPK